LEEEGGQGRGGQETPHPLPVAPPFVSPAPPQTMPATTRSLIFFYDNFRVTGIYYMQMLECS